ncbi:endoribonuclease L-PSP family protein [Mycobacterium xenopi 3993]|nr:endoribonuclease L-PSP family protein [Mycobacterium xenopi 3993]
MTASARLEQLGVTLPQVVRPLASYVPAVRTGNLVYTAGQLPMEAGKLAGTGKVGTEVSPSKRLVWPGFVRSMRSRPWIRWWASTR